MSPACDPKLIARALYPAKFTSASRYEFFEGRNVDAYARAKPNQFVWRASPFSGASLRKAGLFKLSRQFIIHSQP